MIRIKNLNDVLCGLSRLLLIDSEPRRGRYLFAEGDGNEPQPLRPIVSRKKQLISWVTDWIPRYNPELGWGHSAHCNRRIRTGETAHLGAVFKIKAAQSIHNSDTFSLRWRRPNETIPL